VAKIILWIASAFVFIYLIGLAVMFAMIANESDKVTSTELLFGLSPFIMTLDFLFRFLAQQTPSQLIKQYILLPIPRYTCVNSFIASSLITYLNLTWFAMFVPYALMSIVFSYGIITAFIFLFVFWLMILANSQWYSIVRTLTSDSVLYWLLPVTVYALIFSPWYIGHEAGITHLLDIYSTIGTAIDGHSIIPVFLSLITVLVLVLINRKIQYVHIMREISRTETTHRHNVSDFSFFDRYGETGQYLKLEIKSVLRNKNPRTSFISATLIVIAFSLLIAFTDIYDSTMMSNFCCLYNFVIYGAIILVHIMSHEGNYLDGLMVRKENILSLFHAKYWFYTAMLILPLLLMSPIIISGKWSILRLLSFALFTAGFQYFVIFQMAVYNKQTIPLNTKLIGKGGMENNYFQLVSMMIIFFVSTTLVSILQGCFGDTVCYSVISVIGLVFIVTHPLWLRNIYHRMMKRRYSNLEAFRASR